MMRVLVWLAVGVLGVASASALIAAGPERLRPILLMPAAFGALTGYGLRRLAMELRLNRRLLPAILAGLLTIGGLMNVARLSFDQLAAAARRNVAEDPRQLLGLRLLESDLASGGAEARKRYQLARLRLSPAFDDYLTGRLLGFAWLPSPWPAAVWGAELLLAAMLAIRIVARPETGLPAGESASPAGGAGPAETSAG